MGAPLFYIFAFLSISFALLVVFSKNPIYSILYLILTFFTFTVHYILLNAQFLAVVNFIVYMGAIMVLLLFVLMLLNLNEKNEPKTPVYIRGIGIVAGVCLLVTLINATEIVGPSHVLGNPTTIGLVKALGKALFKDFLFPFELSSILLLAAMVGAVLLAKKE